MKKLLFLFIVTHSFCMYRKLALTDQQLIDACAYTKNRNNYQLKSDSKNFYDVFSYENKKFKFLFSVEKEEDCSNFSGEQRVMMKNENYEFFPYFKIKKNNDGTCALFGALILNINELIAAEQKELDDYIYDLMLADMNSKIENTKD